MWFNLVFGRFIVIIPAMMGSEEIWTSDTDSYCF
jgi:hypothetical protein